MVKGAVGLIVGAIVLCALVATGCGGGGGTLTKAEFVKQGNAICKQEEDRRSKIVAEMSKSFNSKGDVAAQQEQLLMKVIPTYEESAARLDGLGAPEADAKKVEEIITAMEGAAARAKANPQTAITSSLPFKKADQLASAYGLKSCVV